MSKRQKRKRSHGRKKQLSEKRKAYEAKKQILEAVGPVIRKIIAQ